MPGCMGTAALAIGPLDMSHCTCSVGKCQQDEIADLRREVKAVSAKVIAFESSRNQVTS